MVSENNSKIRGILQALRELVKALEDMERKGVTERAGSCEITGLWFRAKYGYRTKIGIEREDFSRTYRNPQNSKGKLKTKKEAIEIYDKGSTISLRTRLPFVKEENLKVKVDGNILKVIANVEENKIEKSVSVQEFGIQKALFKNGTLELELNK
jgi:HSP20 family molecular chaperone IbpA